MKCVQGKRLKTIFYFFNSYRRLYSQNVHVIAQKTEILILLSLSLMTLLDNFASCQGNFLRKFTTLFVKRIEKMNSIIFEYKLQETIYFGFFRSSAFLKFSTYLHPNSAYVLQSCFLINVSC